MQTPVLPVTDANIARAAEIIRRGGIVAFPTETVYGLGANALDEAAVAKIFAAKGRPQDNPLIVHIAEASSMDKLCVMNRQAEILAEKFMPGAITVVLPNKIIPAAVTAGLDTVGIRFPSHIAAQKLIKASGVPIAAPSANTSGAPSPTTAMHVFNDMNGKIPLILDGGACSVGVESTVISLAGKTPLLLRPGAVTLEQLRDALGQVDVHPAILNAVALDKAASPGMKYKHYAPACRVLLAAGAQKTEIAKALLTKCNEKKCAVCVSQNAPAYHNIDIKILCDKAHPEQAASSLFALLRELDDQGYKLAVFEDLDETGICLAVMNRLLRACAFTVISDPSQTISI